MRRVRYCVAMSLDGYIAGPNGEADWIVMDPDYDFAELYGEFDTYLVGRKTFESTGGQDQGSMPGVRTFVFSRTLRQADYKNITIVGDDWKEVVQALRGETGKKNIWLFGGGSLFGSLAEAGLVDTVEVAVIPVVLGGGVPLIAAPAPRIKLELEAQDIYKETGTVGLVYSVKRP
ncbi:MAG: dihydrofolate reductase family protein [Acidobacteriota bacterium]|nr:dihydrofolate reductase family protein [Acidobacteriota bacterium]